MPFDPIGSGIEASSPFTVFSDGFTDADAAALYDVSCAWVVTAVGHPEDAYVSGLVAGAESVLDVGCGTGSMLHHARESGHTGRLVGIDPDPSMLARAVRREDVEWVLGTAADIAWRDEFDLATMNSNAFQCLITDDEVRTSLAAVRGALHTGGRFVFGTRHVQTRAWEGWTPDRISAMSMPDGRTVRQWHDIESVEEYPGGATVVMTETTAATDGAVLHIGRSPLRFWDVPHLNAALVAAGFEVAEQSADWSGTPVGDDSPGIVTVARAI